MILSCFFSHSLHRSGQRSTQFQAARLPYRHGLTFVTFRTVFRRFWSPVVKACALGFRAASQIWFGALIFSSPSPMGRGLHRLGSLLPMSELGEGLCPIDNSDPLTQLQLTRCAPKLSQPSPHGRGTTAQTLTYFAAILG